MNVYLLITVIVSIGIILILSGAQIYVLKQRLHTKILRYNIKFRGPDLPYNTNFKEINEVPHKTMPNNLSDKKNLEFNNSCRSVESQLIKILGITINVLFENGKNLFENESKVPKIEVTRKYVDAERDLMLELFNKYKAWDEFAHYATFTCTSSI